MGSKGSRFAEVISTLGVFAVSGTLLEISIKKRTVFGGARIEYCRLLFKTVVYAQNRA